MCVTVPPSSGTTKSAPATPATPVGTTPLPVNPPNNPGGNSNAGSYDPVLNPGGVKLDYSKYAGMSPFDVQTRAFPGGLPTSWDWNQWMAVNPGAGDPRTTDTRGGNITPTQLAQFNNVGGHIDPASGYRSSPGGVEYVGPPPGTTSPYTAGNSTYAANRTLPTAPAPAPSVLKSAPVPSAPPPATPAPGTAPPVTAPTSSTTPNAGNVPGAYAVSPTYGAAASQFDNTSPAARVTGALARRFKPDGWFY